MRRIRTGDALPAPRPRPARLVAPAAQLVAVLAVGLGCTSPRFGDRAAPPPVRNLRVAAASSLQRPFTTIGSRFEERHAGTRVVFNFDASDSLARQLQAGGPGDVIATADEATLTSLLADGRIVGTPRVFARNELAIAVPAGNPRGVRTLADLPTGTVALCAPAAPCGCHTEEVLRRAEVALPEAAVTRRPDATETYSAVVQGRADASVVYATDIPPPTAAAAPTRPPVERVAIPDEANVEVRYPAAPLRDAAEPELATRFVEELHAPETKQLLAEHGFTLP